MSDETDPDLEDLDALLRNDARGTHSPATGAKSQPGDTLPQRTAQTHLQRLLARSAHAGNSLRQAFSSLRDTRNLIDTDSAACAQLAAEMDNWERVMTDLDEAVSSLAIPAMEKIDHGSPAIAHQPGEQAELHTALLAKLAAQEARIHELESRLKLPDSPTDKDAAANSAAVAENTDSPADNLAVSLTVNRLIIAITDQGNLKFPLHKQIITIGRSPQNDIHIRSRFISRYHARIVCDNDGAIIEDLDSSNGISINSQRARRQPLRSGDLIDLGKTQLRYIDLSEGSPGEGQA